MPRGKKYHGADAYRLAKNNRKKIVAIERRAKMARKADKIRRSLLASYRVGKMRRIPKKRGAGGNYYDQYGHAGGHLEGDFVNF